MLILFWVVVYSIVVTASILLLGNPSTLLGHLSLKTLLMLLLDWRFLLGGVLALGARFIFVIINNLASKHEALAHAHLSITALATVASIILVLITNHFLLQEHLTPIQLVGAVIMMGGLFLVFR